MEVSLGRGTGVAEVIIAPDRPVTATDDRKAASLGLWIAHQSTRALGGDLVEPVAPGDPFRVRLPLAEAP